MNTAPVRAPSVDEVETALVELGDHILTTPIWHWRSQRLARRLAPDTRVVLKLELFQHAGSFKPRGALCVMRCLDRPQLQRGVTAVSGGNHAMAVAYAAQIVHTHAKVVMPKTANPARVQASRELGAEVVLTADIASAFAEVERHQREEGRAFVHPFEGPLTALGTATLGLEFLRQAGDLDAVIVPIGGGGLCAGVASVVKQLQPRCQVFGVEPEGADSMHRSFAAGAPQKIDQIGTIADSLGAPYALPYSYALCRRYVDALVKVTDAELCAAMALLFADAKLAVEPASAAATAALLGPLRERLAGARVGLIVCGANIDPDKFHQHVTAGRAGIV
ncbi:MAG TPA: threonine/serine dehydratase [Planctomycetota bacterium]|nr:threonine/serine dehydratase [Planctomycetota bacterium]